MKVECSLTGIEEIPTTIRQQSSFDLTHLKMASSSTGVPAERTPRAEARNCSVWGEVPLLQQPSAAQHGAGPTTAREGKNQLHRPARRISKCLRVILSNEHSLWKNKSVKSGNYYLAVQIFQTKISGSIPVIV